MSTSKSSPPETFTPTKADPVRLTRLFRVPPETVFQAWSSAEHVSRWFGPQGYAIPEAHVEMRVGGRFEVLMRGPDGTDHWTRGHFAEVEPFSRLELDLHATDAAGRILFYAYTEIDLHPTPEGVRMDVTQSYTLLVPEAEMMIRGAPAGWRQTLDRLEVELEDITRPGQVRRSVAHGIFTINRTYPAPIARVFAAFAAPEAKGRWFTGPPGGVILEQSMDIRPGGLEVLCCRWTNGLVTRYEARYFDVVAPERLIYGYDLYMGERKISVSLASVELAAEDPGRTRLKLTEQGAFLDGYDDAGAREHGTGLLMDRLGASLVDD